MAALDHVFLVNDHVVAQIIEAVFVVGTVGDIGGVGGSLLCLALSVNDQTGLESKIAVHASHLLTVAARQIVVDRNDVHALARQRIQIRGQRRNQRFTLTRFHLGDASLVEQNTADDLHAEGTLAQHTPVGLAHSGKGIGQNIVQRFSCGKAGAQNLGYTAQLALAHGGISIRQRLNRAHDGLKLFELMVAVSSKNFRNQRHG